MPEIDAQEIFKEEAKKLNYPIDYGSVRIQVRAGKPTLIVIEKTIKLD